MASRTTLTGSIALAVVLMLGGCAALWQPQAPPGPPPVQSPPPAVQAEAPDELDRLMEDASRFSGLSASERQSALGAEEKRYQQRRTPYNLMRLALLMTLTDPDQGQTDEVVDALHDYATQRRGHTRMGALAAFLSQVLARHGRLLGRNDTLQRKLNELKAIEQKLNEQNKRDMIQVPP